MYLERGPNNVVIVILDANVVIPGGQGRVAHLIPLLDLGAVHGDLAGPVYRDGQGARSGVDRVDYEIGLGARFDVLEAVAVRVDGGRVRGVLAHLDVERRAGYVHAVELDVDLVDAVLARHETHRVLLQVDHLDEAVVLVARRADDLFLKSAVERSRRKLLKINVS